MGALLLLASAGGLRAADAVSREDKEFLKNASELGVTEVELGKIATAKATLPELKALGAKLVADHSEGNAELTQLAAAKAVELKMEPTANQKQMLASFHAKSGAEFDKELMEHIMKDHEKGIRMLTHAAETADDPEIRAFAAKQIPIMQEHHAMAGGKAETE